MALAGNPNSGKTTIFNCLTGGRRHVGNFPGITVEQGHGFMKERPDIQIVDLPGTYSMNPCTAEERVTCEFLKKAHYDAIINIVDAGCLERSLYLSMELLELKKPVILAVNKINKAQKAGILIDMEKLSEFICVPTIAITEQQNNSFTKLSEALMNACENSVFYGARRALCRNLRAESGDTGMSIVNKRYEYIEKVTAQAVVRIKSYRGKYIRGIHPCGMKDNYADYSDIADCILTGKISGIPIFVLIMIGSFAVIFGPAGWILSDWFSSGTDFVFGMIEKLIISIGVNDFVSSLVMEGILAGTGSVLSFLPAVMMLFFLIAFVEESGYMARVAFMMDGILSKYGLSGKAFAVMVAGFGCTVPAIMASRTLDGQKQRRRVVLAAPYISCSARLPVYIVFSGVFFPDCRFYIIISLYLFGIGAALLCCGIMKRYCDGNDESDFLMEIPDYCMPSFRGLAVSTWEKSREFVIKIFSVILIGTVVIWVLQNFGTDLMPVTENSESVLAKAGKFMTPLFEPVGCGDWRAVTALITGFMAKEAVVGTLAVLTGCGEVSALNESLYHMFTPLSAYCYMLFCLLYSPCIACVAAVRRELGSAKYAVMAVLGQTLSAWGAAFVIYHCGLFIMQL